MELSKVFTEILSQLNILKKNYDKSFLCKNFILRIQIFNQTAYILSVLLFLCGL